MVNKNYRKGAEDVGDTAAAGFNIINNELNSVSEKFSKYIDKQYVINKEYIASAEDHEQRLIAVEYRLPSIDFGLVDTLPSEKRALLGGIIRSINLPDEECRRTSNLVISRLGVEPLSSIKIDQVGLLSQDVQRLCTYYLYILLRRTNGNRNTEESINNVLDEFLISNNEKRQIKSVIDDYDIAEIEELIKIRKGGKQNIVVIGKSEAISATLINSVLGMDVVNDGFYQVADEMPTALETNESPIRFCGVFKVGYDNEMNARVLKMAHEVIRTKSEGNRISTIWYCINTQSHRVESYEILLLKELLYTFNNVRIIIIFTNCISKKAAEALSAVINEEISSRSINFVNMLTELLTLDNCQTIMPYGVDDLINLTLHEKIGGAL